MKKVIIFIFNFILVSLLTILCIVTIISKTVLNKNYIETCLSKSDFYNELYTAIHNEFDTYLAQSGIPSGTLNQVGTLNEIQEDVNDTLDAVYNNKTINANNINITENIKNKLSQYTNNTEQIANKLTEVYNKKVVISSKYVNVIGLKMTKLISMVKKGIIAITIVFAILLIIMCAIIGNFKVIINHLGILLCTTGILNIIVKIIIGNNFNNIFLLNTAFSKGIIYIINNVADKIMSIGIGLAVIGLVFIICGSFKKIDKSKEMEN